MEFWNRFRKKCRPVYEVESENSYEYCTRCDANLTLQKGFRNDLSYWVCKGCGQLLTNFEDSDTSNILWFCDQCEAYLNNQEGFHTDCGEWECKACGYPNKIDKSEIYLSEEEYQETVNSPYRGLSEQALMDLAFYVEIGRISNRDDIILVRNMENDRLYVKKLLKTYDESVYEFLLNHPVANMPRILGVYKSCKYLIVIEEYINGRNLLELLNENLFSVKQAADIAYRVSLIAKDLHNFIPPIIHRDIKPSNIMLSEDEKVFLLDMNVAKWYKPKEVEDTRLMGTPHFAAPEQLGYGFQSSSEKADIYAIGILLNVMVTGKRPKEEKAPEVLWNIIDKCIRLSPQERYTEDELIQALEKIAR